MKQNKQTNKKKTPQKTIITAFYTPLAKGLNKSKEGIPKLLSPKLRPSAKLGTEDVSSTKS